MKSDTHLTPLSILLRLGMGFDLDPCCPPGMPWQTAERMFIRGDTDGLTAPWEGRVWLNPPFGGEAWRWMARLAEHGNGIALIPARTETAGFVKHVWKSADAVLFIAGRFCYCRIDGSRHPFNSGAPMVLVAYGSENVLRLRGSGLGPVVTWNKNLEVVEWKRY